MSEQANYNVEYWTQQEQFYLKQLQEDPSKAVMNHLGLACVYEIMSRFDDCFLHCKKVLELSEKDSEKADAHVWMGRAHQAKKEFNPAIAHFLQAIDIDPEHDAAIEDAGTCYTEQKDFINAEYWFRKLEEIEGCEDVAWMRLADLFYTTKDFDRSISYFEKCLAASKDNIEALCGKGRCLAEKKLYTDAIEVFSEASSLHKDDALPQYYLGLCYQNIDDQYMAMHHYMKALELDPGFAEVYNNVGKLYHDFDGDIKTAVDYLERALEFVENSQLRQMIYINLVRLNQRIANYERRDFYNSKLLDDLGFGGLFSGEDGDEFGDLGEEDPDDLI